MFKQLRTRLLLMNLSMISVLLFISFASIYIFTYNNIQTQINGDLIKASEFKRDTPPPYTLDITPENDGDVNFDTQGNSFTPPPEDAPLGVLNEMRNINRMASFTIVLDGDMKIIDKTSFFDAEDTFYEEALGVAFANTQENGRGRISLDGNEWAFIKTFKEDITFYTFVEISPQKAILNRLIYTFLVVFVVTFIFIYFISLFLTNKSILPIREAFERQKQFISDASHELKTPLAVIQTNVDVLLQNEDKDFKENKKWLTYIKNEVIRMGNLTKDLLYLTQMTDDESQTMISAPFNLSDHLENQLLGLEVVAFEKQVALNYDLLPDVSLMGNAEQIMQVVMILMDNAIKYTPEHGQIDLKLSTSSHHVQLDIINTGDGISEDDLPHIFDRFYRVDKVRSRNSASYGLGLSIAKAIVERHHGKITCHSIAGEKTQFTLRFKQLL